MIGWLRRRFGRRQPSPPIDPAQAATSAALSVELRLLAERLRQSASDLAAIHGVERRGGHHR